MLPLRVFTPYVLFNIILVFSFSVTVNSYVQIQNINIIFYIIFHLTFIYFLFYQYHYSLFILGFVYGILLDIFLINEIGSHLINLLILILLYTQLKKYLFQLTSFQISITIFITLNLILMSELLFAFLVNDIYFNFFQIIKYIVISFILLVPSLFLLNRIDN